MDYRTLYAKTVAALRLIAKQNGIKIPVGVSKMRIVELILEGEHKNAEENVEREIGAVSENAEENPAAIESKAENTEIKPKKRGRPPKSPEEKAAAAKAKKEEKVSEKKKNTENADEASAAPKKRGRKPKNAANPEQISIEEVVAENTENPVILPEEPVQEENQIETIPEEKIVLSETAVEQNESDGSSYEDSKETVITVENAENAEKMEAVTASNEETEPISEETLEAAAEEAENAQDETEKSRSEEKSEEKPEEKDDGQQKRFYHPQNDFNRYPGRVNRQNGFAPRANFNVDGTQRSNNRSNYENGYTPRANNADSTQTRPYYRNNDFNANRNADNNGQNRVLRQGYDGNFTFRPMNRTYNNDAPGTAPRYIQRNVSENTDADAPRPYTRANSYNSYAPRYQAEGENAQPRTSIPETTDAEGNTRTYSRSVNVAEARTSSENASENFDPNLPNPSVQEMLLNGDCPEGGGVLEIQPEGYGFLRAENFLPGTRDVYMSMAQIRRFCLRSGDYVVGKTRAQREGDRYVAMMYITSINGASPEEIYRRPRFDDLTPIYPDSRIRLEREEGNTDLALRAIDLVAPIGKGQRGLIVSPPKAGKTVLLKKIANAITENYPDMHLIVLLIDERPEEVTDLKRSIKGEVVYSTFDEMPDNHTRLSEMTLDRAQRLVEMGKDVIILMDSITRLARAYNLVIPPTGRSLSGGLDPGALYKPKRFFGAARNIENGGSLTIIATALVETGSRMDDIIYEEFKGTGNMELHLDRKLSEKRIFPAVDLDRSGTRRDELLYDAEEAEGAMEMRRMLATNGSQDNTEQLIELMEKTRDNREFLSRMKGWAAVWQKEGYI